MAKVLLPRLHTIAGRSAQCLVADDEYTVPDAVKADYIGERATNVKNSKTPPKAGISILPSLVGNYYIGLDLSYSGTGLVVLKEGAAIVSVAIKAGSAKEPFYTRAATLVERLIYLLPPPELSTVVVEGAAFAAEFGAFKLGQLAGVVEYALTRLGYVLHFVQPTVLKKYATGKGNAQKTYVAAMIEKKWGFAHPDNNVTDAYVLAKMGEAGAHIKVSIAKVKKPKTAKSIQPED